MARCKLTNMNLRNIRKTREYQCLLIDLVKTNVVPKSTAEDLLGYTIPTGLLGDTTPATDDDDDDDDDEPGSGGEGSGGEGSGTEGSGTEGSGGETDNAVTLLYPSNNEEWHTAEYDLTDDPTGEGIIAFAQNAFSDNTINVKTVAEENLEYVEGETDFSYKYNSLNPQPEGFEPGMLIVVYHKD